MEEKKISEKESLELISRMIQQTKKDSAIGSGDMFLIWGYIGVIVSVVVSILAMAFGRSWGWLFFAIPIAGIVAMCLYYIRRSKRTVAPDTYLTKNISSVWNCLSLVFVFYTIICIVGNNHSGWSGMFLLGFLLPAIGTTATGMMLCEKWVIGLGIVSLVPGVYILLELCCMTPITTVGNCILMAVTMLVALVIPGHYLNYKSRKLNS